MRELLGAITLFIIVVLSSETACSQRNLTEIVGTDQLSIDFQFLGKVGPTKKYFINPADIPNAPPIPTEYKLLGSNAYYVKTEVVTYSPPMFTFTLPKLAEPDFNRIRILRLMEDETSPIGSRWEDCTFLPREIPDRPSPYPGWKPDPAQLARIKKFLPNYLERKISCEVESRDQEYYLAVTQQLIETPTEPFTDLKVSLEDPQESKGGGKVLYRITFKNNGPKDIAEINLLSRFGGDTTLNSATPSQGKCKPSDFGGMNTSSACSLGKLAVGRSLTIDFVGSPSGFSGEGTPHPQNKFWHIFGSFKQTPGSMDWRANSFNFEPLSSR